MSLISTLSLLSLQCLIVALVEYCSGSRTQFIINQIGDELKIPNASNFSYAFLFIMLLDHRHGGKDGSTNNLEVVSVRRIAYLG